MAQNTSSAVMQQRSEPHDSLDDFPTPPWATRALCEFLSHDYGDLSQMTVREPAANRGHMVEPLQEYFGTVVASDAFFPFRDGIDAAAKAGFTIKLHGGGMLTGPRRKQIDANWRDYVMPHDLRIAELTGQPFGENYFDY